MSNALPVVFMFSGQGSHYYRMGSRLFAEDPVFRSTMNRLDELATRALGASVVRTVYDPARNKADLFDDTRFTSPAIFMLELALAHTLIARGLRPDILLGVSLGTFAALAVSGCFEPERVLEAIIAQAHTFHEHCPAGSMLAIMHDPKLYDGTPLLRDNADLAGVNFHSHFVISATTVALSEIEAFLRARQISFQRLAVSRPFHSRWIDQARQSSLRLFASLNPTPLRMPIVCCAQAQILQSVESDALWRVAREPIRFERTVAFLEARGPSRYVDVGPSSTLATLLKYALPPTSTSRAVGIISPFSDEGFALERVIAHDEPRRGPASSA